MKTWNIWDFPDKINVILKDEIHKEFFNYMFKKLGGKRPYARFLRVYQNHMKYIHKKCFKKNGKVYNFYLPIWVLKKSLPLINETLKKKIEINILAIKCSGIGTKILNPKLPIKESPALYRIIAHLLEDGFAGERKVLYYSNTCNELRKQFKKDLQIFGEVITYERTPCTIQCLMFPKVIADILKYIFDIKFTRPTKLPKELLFTKNENKIEFLKSLYDDEGTVSTNLAIGMNNFGLIKEIKELVETMNVNTGKITSGKSSCGGLCYSFSIPSKEIRNFKDTIGFYHPDKIKRLNLKLNIKTRNKNQRTRPLIWTRKEILGLLKEKPRTTFELSDKLLLTISGIYFHLNYLRNENN